MKKVFLALLCLATLSGCYNHTQTHGDGPFGEDMVVYEKHDKHWYILWGLVDMSPVDIDAVVKENPNCRVTTQASITDNIIALFTGSVSITPRTVTFEIPVNRNTPEGREVIERQRKKALRAEAREKQRRGEGVGE